MTLHTCSRCTEELFGRWIGKTFVCMNCMTEVELVQLKNSIVELEVIKEQVWKMLNDGDKK